MRLLQNDFMLILCLGCFSHTDAAVQETRKLLQKAYLSEESLTLWTGAPELFQFDRRVGRVTEDTDQHLRDIDYSSHFETLEHFSSEIETVSIKLFVNAIVMAKEKDHFFLIKGHPGSGRTVLLRRVCAFWARGFCLRRFTLVLWLDLKAHPSSPSDISLMTLLCYSLPQDSHLDSIQQWLERHGTQDMLILVDGVEGQAYIEWKPFLEWLAGTEASVILTATSPIQIKASTRSIRYHTQYLNLCQYDLLGLSQDQISKQVIHHYCHDPSRAEEFLMYISEAHDIRALCSSAPYLAAVLFVFDSVSTKDLPNTWTQLFTSLQQSLSSVSDHDNICFTLPLLQHYLCAQHIHSLPHDQHVPALNEETVPLHVRRFYIGLCNTPELIDTALSSENRLLYAACISEVVIEELGDVMTSELTFYDQWSTLFDIYRIFKAVHYSGLMCKLEFHRCHFGSLTFEMMAKWLTTYSILPSGGAVQELRCVCVCVRAMC